MRHGQTGYVTHCEPSLTLSLFLILQRYMDKSDIHLPAAPSLPNVVVTKQGTKDHTHQNLARQPHPFWTNCTDNISSPQQHYEQIKELVEFGHTHSPLRPLSPSPLSPLLLSYISHLWNK